MGQKQTIKAVKLNPFAGTVLADAAFELKELRFIQIHSSGIEASARPIMQFPREVREVLLSACFVTTEDGEEEVCPNLAIYFADNGRNRGIAIVCGETVVQRAIAPHKLVGEVLADQLLQDQVVIRFLNTQAAENAQSMVDYA